VIAITFALTAESSGIVRLIREDKIDNHQVLILHTGVGRKSVEPKIDNFLRAQRPTVLISSGFAGSLRDELRVGDLILAANFSEPGLLGRARRVLPGARTVTLRTSDSVADANVDRDQIAQTSGADAADMETEVIAAACAAHSVPLLSLRAISDSPTEPFPAPPNVLFDIERQRTNGVKLALHLLTHPHNIPRLLAFARGIARARENLTAALRSVVAELDR
jgi:nucleoside phosphorylase